MRHDGEKWLGLVLALSVGLSPGFAFAAYNGSSGVILRGTSGTIGGTALIAGGCSTGTVNIAGATMSAVVDVTPAASPGGSTQWSGLVTSAGTVTVSVCVIVAGTPTATTYNVRVIP